MLARLEAGLMALPNGILLVGFAALGAFISGNLDPSFGLNKTSAVLFAALTLAFIVITCILELLRVPYIRKRHGQHFHNHLRLFPLALILGTIFVVLSRTVDFRPGWVFGITCGLVIGSEVGEDHDAASLAVGGIGLIVTAVVAWIVWVPWSSAVQAAHPSLGVVFVDAFLGTLWISSLQAVLFGFAPLEALYGKTVQRWNPRVWFGIYFTATFLLLQFLLHPSAWRWGGLDDQTFWQMFALFACFFVGALVFWAWFQHGPGNKAKAGASEDLEVGQPEPVG